MTKELPARIGTYQILRKLGEGGMGIVYEAQREDSDAPCALKVLRPGLDSREIVQRFRREAEVLRQLRHPGIAAFFEAGEAQEDTESGSVPLPYLAMEMVEGENLRDYAHRARLGDRDRIELVARIADAAGHAHERGIVHRDLKPENVVVGPPHGEARDQPKILDFGVARAAEFDVHHTTTQTGALVGTIPYMSPEQVAGDKNAVDSRSDVYSLGVILFELLAGQLPYEIHGKSIPEAAQVIQFEEPTRLGSVAGRLAGDLELVVAQALEKNRERRYQSASDFARDLRAVLAGASVQARAPSWWQRSGKWIDRHRVASTCLGIATVALAAMTFLWAEALASQRSAHASEAEARRNQQTAQQRSEALRQERASVLRLADFKMLRDLERRDAELWPVHPDLVPGLEQWIEEAEELVGRLPEHSSFLAQLQHPENLLVDPIDHQQLEWWRETLATLVAEITQWADPTTGRIGRVESRLQAARELWDQSLGDYEEDWLDAVADVSLLDLYQGLEIEPQLGLVPLGPDPESGLWEFAHVLSGEIPERDDEDVLEITEDTALVFVLVPGGSSRMGAQSQAPFLDYYDPAATYKEDPVHDVTLSPFFLSKYEMTQGQWMRMTGRNPSLYPAGISRGDALIDKRNPVERVSWEECSIDLARHGLALPTEAQWEYAARAGTSSPWWFGTDPSEFPRAGNIADQHALAINPSLRWPRFEPWNDGAFVHTTVGSYRANPWGFHDVYGNVGEWCRDAFAGDFYAKSPTLDPLNRVDDFQESSGYKISRGGSFSTNAREASSAIRFFFDDRNHLSSFQGVRPSREIEE